MPSKMMIRAANLVAEAGRLGVMGGTATVDPDWGPVAARIRQEATDSWDDEVAVKRFEGKGGTFLRGSGPAIPPIAGLSGTPFWTNRQAIETEVVPESLVVLGGDVTGKGAFTHVGMYQADIVIADILGSGHDQADYSALPRVTFTDPEVASVGPTEAQASDAGIDVATAQVDLRGTARGWLHKVGNDGLIKLVADSDRGVLVGATSAGPAGGEVLSMLTLAVHEATPVSRLRSMIYAYPTFHRGVLDALGALDA